MTLRATLKYLLALLPGLALAGPVDTLQPGQWYEAPNTRMDAVKPSPLPAGVEGVAAVMDDWSGGAFDTRRNRLLVWGGGHAGYCGNEVYAFSVDTLQWTRLSQPSACTGGSGGKYADGQPRSTHTYDHIEYAASTDTLVTLGQGALWENGWPGYYVGQFNFGTAKWTEGAVRPEIGTPTGQVSDYDPVTGTIWTIGDAFGHLAQYDPAADKWTVSATETPRGLSQTGAVDPARRLLVAVGYRAGWAPVVGWNLTNSNVKGTAAVTSGDKYIETQSSPGFEYDPVIKKFVGWSGGRNVYTLDPTNWTWTKIAGTGADPGAANASGTYGRFAYVPSKNVYVVVNKTDRNVFFFKLSSGAGEPPPPPPPDPPPPPPPPPTGGNFSARCAAPGVVKCVGFDGTDTVRKDDNTHPSWNGQYPQVDTAVKASGAGSLKFTIPSNSGSNSSGFFMEPMGQRFSQNSHFYIQFRQRFSPTMFQSMTPNGGWKQVIFHDVGSSCASVELTTNNQYMRGFPQMYSQCGADPFDVEIAGSDFLYQQGDYNCKRTEYANASPNCGYYKADQWMTFYWDVKVGTWGQPNSHVKAYMAYEGGPLKQFIDQPNLALYRNSQDSDAYSVVQLTPYHTNKLTSQVHPPAYTWYDELIVSTQPIAAPGSGPPPPPPPPPDPVVCAGKIKGVPAARLHRVYTDGVQGSGTYTTYNAARQVADAIERADKRKAIVIKTDDQRIECQ